jgi:hypothetical protein
MAAKKGVEPVLARRHLELPDDIGVLVLGSDVEIVGSLGVDARADQHELGPFIVEEVRVCGREAPAADFALQCLG